MGADRFQLTVADKVSPFALWSVMSGHSRKRYTRQIIQVTQQHSARDLLQIRHGNARHAIVFPVLNLRQLVPGRKGRHGYHVGQDEWSFENVVRPEKFAPFDDRTIIFIEVENSLVGDGYYDVVACRGHLNGLATSWYGQDLS